VASDDLPDHLLRWLEAVQRRVVAQAEPLLSPQARAVGLRRLRLVQLIPSTGISQTELAGRALVTKQALGPAIDALEADGLVQRTVDPSDARAWRLHLTPAGEAVSRSLDEALSSVQADLERTLGATQAHAFLDSLRTLGRDQIGTATEGVDAVSEN
jgi:DNA-binding MarR family transcriptional regulator